MNRLPDTRASLILRLPDARDIVAWEELVATYGPAIYRVARSRGLQPADADDLVQEVFAAVARAVGDWLNSANRGPFRAWLLRIARNVAVNFLTRWKHRVPGIGGDDLLPGLAGDATRSGDDWNDIDHEYRRELFRWAAIQVRDAVAPRTWQAFWATAVEQRPIADVARELGTSEGNVYIARSRVMARLRECVRRREDFEP